MKDNKFNREFVKKAIEDGESVKTLLEHPVVQEMGLKTAERLRAQIRGLYTRQAFADKLLKQLDSRRKRPELAAPKQPKKPKKTAAKVEKVTADTPVVAENVVASEPKRREYPDEGYISNYHMKVVREAFEKGAILDCDFIAYHFELIKNLPMLQVYVPRMVLNTLRRMIEFGNVPLEMEDNLQYLEACANILEEAPSEIRIFDKRYKARSCVFARHVINVRRNLCSTAVVLSKSREVEDILAEYC